MIVKLLTEHHLEFLSLKGGCRGCLSLHLSKCDTLLEITCHGSFHIISASRFPTPSSTLTDLVTITGDKQHLAALINLFEDHISQDWFEPWDSLNWVVNNL